MANPTKKSEAMESILTKLTGVDRRATIESDRCFPPPIGCGKEVTSFRDSQSEKEYSISGLCQECQDEVFGS